MDSPHGSAASGQASAASAGGGAARRALARFGPPVALIAVVALVVSGALPFECPVRAALGVPCPGCGMTRATHLLFHGELRAALQMHPLVLVLGPWCAALVAGEIAGHLKIGTFASTMRRPFFRVGSYVVFGAAIALWIARFLGLFGGPCPR